jgi:hypothetical protein
MLARAPDFIHQKVDEMLEPLLQVHRGENGLAFDRPGEESARDEVGDLIRIFE